MTYSFSEKVQAQSLVDVVAEKLETAIVSGSLAPGSRLSEQALAASLGVSRGPLREAIRRLEGRKLLKRTPNIGVHVAALSLTDLRELLEVREALEGMACALAAHNMTDKQIDALQALIDGHEQQPSVQQGTGYHQAPNDYDFHFRIVTGSGNQRLIQMLLGDLYYLLRVYRYRSSTKPGRAKQALAEHREIIAMLKKRDAAAADAAMRTHLRNARQMLDMAEELNKGEAAEAA